MMNHWMGGAFAWSWMVFGLAVPLGLAVLIAGGIVLARRASAGGRDESATDALWVLRQRLARGEIDEEEYAQKKDQLFH